MKSASTALPYIIAGVVLAMLGGFAVAQVYNGPPQPTALVCAYNSGGPPTPTAGKFYYVQCNSSGQIIVQ